MHQWVSVGEYKIQGRWKHSINNLTVRKIINTTFTAPQNSGQLSLSKIDEFLISNTVALFLRVQAELSRTWMTLAYTNSVQVWHMSGPRVSKNAKRNMSSKLKKTRFSGCLRVSYYVNSQFLRILIVFPVVYISITTTENRVFF